MSEPTIIDKPLVVGPGRAGRLPGWALDLAALLFFGLISLVMLWPLSGHLAVSTPNEGDALQQIWSIGWASHSLTTDPANLFNGNIFYPYLNTLAYSDHLLAQTLQGLPIYLLTGNLVLEYGLLTLFSFILSGWGTYLLVKEITGSRAAGLFAGMIFAFASYKVGRISQLNILSTQWIPFCFLFLRRMLNQDEASRLGRQLKGGWGNTLAFAGFFVLNALSSFYFFFYIIPVLGLYLLGFYIARRRFPRPALLLKLLASALLAAIFIVPTLLPYLALVNDQQVERTPREVEQFSANYRFYLGVTENNLFWGSTLSRFSGSGGERALFPGALAYLFSALAVLGPLGLRLLGRRKVEGGRRKTIGEGANESRQSKHLVFPTWVFSIIVVFSVLMSLGWTLHLRGLDIPGPYRFFYLYFPGWVGLRAAMRYGAFVLFGLAILAGIGAAWLFEKTEDRRRKTEDGGQRSKTSASALMSLFSSTRLMAVSSVFILTLLLFGAFWEYRAEVTYINPNILPNPPEVYRWLAEPAQAGVALELPPPPDVKNGPSIRDYYTTFHWQPTVNGLSGYLPPVMQDVADLSKQFPSKESLAAFQGIGVRWLVYHLEDENTPLSPAEWQKIEARLAQTPEVKLVKDFPKDRIKVYELAANPWIRQAYAGLAAGAEVIVSDYRRTQPALIELFQAMLRRDGHALYGADRAGYRYLNSPPTGKPVFAGLFAADEDPTLYGFSPGEVVWSGYGLKFYRRNSKLLAVYDLARDPALAAYNRLTGSLDLKIEKDGLKFNGQKISSYSNVAGDVQVNLLLGSFEAQTVRLNGITVELPGGLSRWRSPKLPSDQQIRLELAPGQNVVLNRLEVVAYDPTLSLGLAPMPGAVLLKASSTRSDNRLNSSFTVWTPPLSDKEGASYIMTLDIYRRPWGTHPGGHFGTYSIALEGQSRARTVQFEFDPLGRKLLATVDGAGVGIGAETFPAAGNGEWAAFITLRRNNPANPKDFPLVGLSRLYEFSLDGDKLSEVNLFTERQLVLLPPVR